MPCCTTWRCGSAAIFRPTDSRHLSRHRRGTPVGNPTTTRRPVGLSLPSVVVYGCCRPVGNESPRLHKLTSRPGPVRSGVAPGCGSQGGQLPANSPPSKATRTLCPGPHETPPPGNQGRSGAPRAACTCLRTDRASCRSSIDRAQVIRTRPKSSTRPASYGAVCSSGS